MKLHVYVLHPDPSKPEDAVLMFSVTRRGEFLACGHDDTLLIPVPVSYTHLTLPTNREV